MKILALRIILSVKRELILGHCFSDLKELILLYLANRKNIMNQYLRI